jgi:hypothetical protein
MNVIVQVVGAILGRVAGWVVLGLLVWLLRLIGKSLGTLGQPLLERLGARRMEAEAGPPTAAAGPAGGAPVTCPHCGAVVASGPFCTVCGRALPET